MFREASPARKTFQAGEAIFSELRNRREHDVKTLAYALTAWAMVAKEEEKRVQ
jgi:hypothetical protein